MLNLCQNFCSTHFGIWIVFALPAHSPAWMPSTFMLSWFRSLSRMQTYSARKFSLGWSEERSLSFLAFNVCANFDMCCWCFCVFCVIQIFIDKTLVCGSIYNLARQWWVMIFKHSRHFQDVCDNFRYDTVVLWYRFHTWQKVLSVFFNNSCYALLSSSPRGDINEFKKIDLTPIMLNMRTSA